MLDKNDTKIIELLELHSNLSVRDLAKKIGLPATTVYNRIRKLNEKGVIKRYTIDLDYSKLGKAILAYILVKVDQKTLSERDMSRMDLVNELKKNKSIISVASVTGQNDIVLKTAIKDIIGLNEFLYSQLKGIPGIERTETMIILNEK
jgi:Lrp/AsnC family transcriptional regulator, leucine-responsive regulatory protein